MAEYLYLEIYNDLKADIKSGKLVTGSRLPTEKELVEKYGVSRITAIKAMQKLENKGYIKRIRGNGSFVTYNNVSLYRDSQISINTQSKNIAFIAKCSTDIFIYFLSNFQKLAISHGYNVSIFDTETENIKESEIIRSISGSEFCGIACKPSMTFENIPEFAEIMKSKTPIVFIDGSVPMLKIPSVKSNNYLGGYKITKFLIENGHKNIGIVFSDISNKNEQERFSGYLQALVENNIEYKSNMVFTFRELKDDFLNKNLWGFSERPKCIVDNIKEILRASNRPTAFFCMYDELAALLEQYAIELGYKIPDDLSLVGYNNSQICDQMIVPLTSVDQDYRRIAECAFQLITGNEKNTDENLVEPEIFVRESVKNIK